MLTYAVDTSVNQWGKGLAVRINKAVAKGAGVTEGTRVRITAQEGSIIVEKVETTSSLGAMLAAPDPDRLSGEAMAFEPVGKEIL
ncbi:hypothetical protein ASD15_05190 [Massilia sp. Root351]|jgi:antitoxin MazE|uniref:AbrB/MazE/SpoVT family DNA-binding domain-containing protein n=1 Tax=Massilia sp. Root351 TaxID=1736522 RepID=UPI00070D18E3|nr:hypothetical protein [Massilia sp. Root351]KQV84585.1 hypothetical protein ASD15_05190 [Massilia sp. Root351]